jgi:hypothetical protein
MALNDILFLFLLPDSCQIYGTLVCETTRRIGLTSGVRPLGAALTPALETVTVSDARGCLRRCGRWPRGWHKSLLRRGVWVPVVGQGDATVDMQSRGGFEEAATKGVDTDVAVVGFIEQVLEPEKRRDGPVANAVLGARAQVGNHTGVVLLGLLGVDENSCTYSTSMPP